MVSELDGKFYLKKTGGGACVAVTATTVIIATWNQEISTDGAKEMPQSAFLCNTQVERLAEHFLSINY